MKLHLSPDVFETILLTIAKREDIRSDVLEKDYYVTLLLKELSFKQDELKAYFKGGTALYKALSSINRFSEDIDLTVYDKDCSKTQGKKRLEKSAQGYTALKRLTDDNENINSKGNVTSVYGYESTFSNIDNNDPLQRFGRVKVEATSFTTSEPWEVMEITPIIYTKATDSEKEILEREFDVAPFQLQTIKLERIFVDKLFAAEFYYIRYKASNIDSEENYAFDVAKHIYDLMILYKHPKIIDLISDLNSLKELVSLKRAEEALRKGGIQADLRIKDFSYATTLLLDKEFKVEYNRMQEIYVFKDVDKIPLSEAKVVFDIIKSIDI
ncbi:nucleotidyl transferase AbiEii/AbiGii toxin family protein [Desulfosporosinus sp. SYSU MS00001]|uniref:nucleotidyl transferase AbiEii/AbiGii toxin family protein n=1 Tax=Desulfosporosinus sp. SYSU MS00001 TaxID=3416284 RepID=UPI003CF5EFD8